LRFKPSELGEILCYPQFNVEEFKLRLMELEKLNVDFVESYGGKNVGKFRVLGKGCESLVVKVSAVQKPYALKIRRTDAGKPSLEHEAMLTKIVNKFGVGARIYGSTKNFLLLEFVDGVYFKNWVENLSFNDRFRLVKVLKDILLQCRVLDKVGVDHGELSRAFKHILVDKFDKPYIIDFGKASVNRKASNVTSMCQYLFIKEGIGVSFLEFVEKLDKGKLIELLREYKKNPGDFKFNKILEFLGLNL
ncbi:MAG: hypothetical protein N3E48_00960, partial [Candidatus Bathyarchaeota archaeon]|nr:hypothetical protein [Candidatus Bathyarchaeota archaeon]